MAILDTLEQVKTYIGELKRKYRFRKARLARKDAVDLQDTLIQCRGKLELCKRDLNRTVNNQSRNIQEGLARGNDVAIQEQMLWDAAVGYMLVDDAIYALETINSYEAVSNAYDMLEAAMKQISRKKAAFPALKIGSTNERNAYGYITSYAAQREKETMLEGFFEVLKREGNIEKQLDIARNPQKQQTAATGELSELDALRARLDSSDAEEKAEENFDDLDSLDDIHPPRA